MDLTSEVEPPAALPEALANALVTGPFELALRLAVARSGFGLEGIQRRLASRGLRVSLASLSNWQTGRSRPERPSSMQVVEALEEIFGLSVGALVELLERARRQGRQPRPDQGVEAFRAAHGSEPPPGVEPAVLVRTTEMANHCDLFLSSDRGIREIVYRTVVQADTAGVDRYLAVCHQPSGTQPAVEPLANCEVGQSWWVGPARMLVVELRFPRPLRHGETHVIDYRVLPTGQLEPATEFWFARHYPTKHLLMRAHFDGNHLPARCRMHRAAGVGLAREALEQFWFGASAAVHHHVAEAGTGGWCLDWEWE